MAELPFATPLTAQVTPEFAEPVTEAVKRAVWPGARVAEGGVRESEIEPVLTMVTVADADCEPATASTVTGFDAGTAAGGV